MLGGGRFWTTYLLTSVALGVVWTDMADPCKAGSKAIYLCMCTSEASEGLEGYYSMVEDTHCESCVGDDDTGSVIAHWASI